MPCSPIRCSSPRTRSPRCKSLAHHVRRQWGRRVVAITGSAGKTTTKEAVAAALGAKFRVLKSEGNLNNSFGLPLQLLRLMPEHEFAVVEMGMNHSGEIAALARIAAPDWGVITNVGTAHIENFADGQAGIARAKFELVAALPANGVAFLNCDDAYAAQFGRDFPGRVVYFGSGPCADPQILSSVEDLDGLHVHIRAGEREGSFTLHLLGAHNALNAVAGLAVALEAGVDLDAAVAASLRSPPGTSAARSIEIAGATILNDSYNSNPEALRSMIRTLAARPAKGRRILVAGEMLEMGEHGPALHTACGRAAAEAGLDLVVAVQGNAEHLATAACAGGVPVGLSPRRRSRRPVARAKICAPATSSSSKARAAFTSSAPSNRQSQFNMHLSEQDESSPDFAARIALLVFARVRCSSRRAVPGSVDQAISALPHRGQSLLRGQRRTSPPTSSPRRRASSSSTAALKSRCR